MYQIMFKILKLPASQVRSTYSHVFNFSGKTVWPIAIAEVPVKLGLVHKIVKFIVMNIDSPCNAILGHGWLGQMKVVASLYHQKLKFLSKYRLVEIREKTRWCTLLFWASNAKRSGEQCPAELAKCLQAGDKKEEAKYTSQGKRNKWTVDKLESS